MRKSLGPAMPVVAVVAAVTTLVLGSSVVTAVSSARLGADQPGMASSDATPGVTTELDLGQLSDPAAVAACLAPGFATDPAAVSVLYGVRQRRASGSAPVFVLRNADGVLRLCDATGADVPSQSPLPRLSDAAPIAFLSNGQSTWRCSPDGELQLQEATSWLLVAPSVQTVQQRYWIDGDPGPWFSTRAQSGFVHLHTWLRGPQEAGTRYAVQSRVLDASGAVVPQRALPTDPTSLPGCAAGNAVIG